MNISLKQRKCDCKKEPKASKDQTKCDSQSKDQQKTEKKTNTSSTSSQIRNKECKLNCSRKPDLSKSSLNTQKEKSLTKDDSI
jgi:hypothetical protein